MGRCKIRQQDVFMLGLLIPLVMNLAACNSGAGDTALQSPMDDADVIMNDVDASDQSDVVVATNDGPAGDSGITLDDRRYKFDAALGDIWGVKGQHYNVNLTLTDGNFMVTSAEMNGDVHRIFVPTAASVVFYAEMYYPGVGFNFSSFDFVHHSDKSAITELPYFNRAYVGVDIDGSGLIESLEQFEIIAGNVSFGGNIPNLVLQFSLVLSNGQIAEGHYKGLFDFTTRSRTSI